MHTAQVAHDAARSAGAEVPAVELRIGTRTSVRGRSYAMCVPADVDARGPGSWRHETGAGLLVPLLGSPAAPGRVLAGRGQLVAVPRGRYDWIYLQLGAHAEGGDDEIWLHYENVAEPEPLRVQAGAAARVARVPVPRPDPLVAFRLPELHRLEVLAATLAGPSGSDRRWHPVDLAAYANCAGIEPARRPGSGAFNIWLNTFPAEDLPPAGAVVDVGGVPFRFPMAGGNRPDNLRCRGQRIALPPGRVDWLYLLAAAERRSEDLLTVHYADGASRAQWLRVSDFWPETPAWFGELLAFRTESMLYPHHVDRRMAPSIWRQRVPVAVRDGAVAVTLPDNPAIHVFALTAVDEETGA